MKIFVTAVLGIILLCSAFSGRAGDFYRIRSLSIKGAGKIIVRILYAIAGIMLIVMAFSGML